MILDFNDPTPPPCIGQGELFGSTNPADHQLARVFCNKGRKVNKRKPECPFLVACQTRLEQVVADVPSANSSAEGTWAGELVGVPGRPGRPRKKAA